MTPNPARAVLFDVFGTLVHFGRKRRPFLTLMQDLPPDRERALGIRRRLMTSTVPTIRDAATSLAESLRQPLREEVIRAAEVELEEHLASCRLAEGAQTLLRELREDGYGVALVSNLASVYVPVLQQLGLREMVDHATYSCEVGRIKPDPGIYDLTLETLGVEPANATMVGNSLRADVVGAKRSGLQAVWITENRDPEHACVARLEDLRSVLA